MSSAISETFIVQAEACEQLGSAFTGALCRTFATHLDESTEVGKLCLGWKGDAGPSGDSIPLRLCGGLHALVLTNQDQDLAAHYPPQSITIPPWEVMNAALVKHEAFLLDWMTSPPQTNEVARSCVIWPAFMAIAKKVDMPLRLLEVGASGGLNLNACRFSYKLGDVSCGVEDSPLHLEPEWKGTEPDYWPTQVKCSEGCDINPLDITSPRDQLRLRSYVWPDQKARVERMNSALVIAGQHPVEVHKADAIDWLSQKLAEPTEGMCTVVYSTIAWQYLPQTVRTEGERIIEDAAKRADAEASPLAWVRFEADGKTPGAGIRLQLWPEGIDTDLGRADFHGRWVDWRGM